MLLSDNLMSRGVVFVGLNPSFSVPQIKSYVQMLRKEKPQSEWPEDSAVENLFKWTSSRTKKQSRQTQDIDDKAFKEHPYFQKPRCIAKKAGKEFVHLDIFRYRETSQVTTLEDLKVIIQADRAAKPEDVVPDKFARSQLDTFYALLEECDPLAIVVINAAASKLLKSTLNLGDRNFRADENEGYHQLSFSQSRKCIPVLFSGMLSGQRALDLDSVARLSWHLRYALGERILPR